MINCFTLSLEEKYNKEYQSYNKRTTIAYGLLFTITLLAYNASYFAIKQGISKIDPLYLALMVGNLLVLILLSLLSYKSYYFCKILAFWSILGLFLESFQYYFYINSLSPYNCTEHQLRIASYIPLTYFTAALL